MCSRTDRLGFCATLLSRFEQAALARIGPLASEADAYDYHPLGLSEFLDGMEAIRRLNAGPRFLDVGCGIGSKLVVALDMGFTVSGIDVQSAYVAMARELCPEAAVEVRDARTYDCYGDFDVVYCHRLFVSETGQRGLERRITEQMNPGALLFLPGRAACLPGWREAAPDLWRRA